MSFYPRLVNKTSSVRDAHQFLDNCTSPFFNRASAKLSGFGERQQRVPPKQTEIVFISNIVADLSSDMVSGI